MGWGERHQLHWACATGPGSVPGGMGGAEPPGRGHRWHQAAFTGTGVPGEPWAGIPSPSRALSSAMEVTIQFHRLVENEALFSQVGSWVVISDVLSTGQRGCH